MKNQLLSLLALLCSLYCFSAPPTVTSFSPVSAVTGVTITITGTNFTGATDVSFGGTSASSFIVVSATQITAVVASGTSGSVQVTTAGGSGSKTGFTYVPTSGIITDYGGYWNSTAISPNSTQPDDSYNLLAFTFNGTTYSTGVNNSILNTNSITYTAGNYKALPVAGISGTTPSSGSTYLALAKKVDGSANVANAAAVSSYSVKSVLTDGANGLNLGTGVTNLPTAAILTFQISNINSANINDAEPDIILTQIAQPVVGNDQFSFVDASGTVVGTTISQDMTLLPLFGNYALDLFNLTPNTPYNNATAFSAFGANTTREIRLAAFRLSDFGITPANVSQVKALKISPSGNSDYAFIAYNAAAINLPPNITQNTTATNTAVCSGGTANLSVLAAAVGGGSLSYSWEESVNGGSTWTPVTNGGNYSGAATDKLVVANAINNYRYRATVTESGNVNTSTSADFIISVSTPSAPSAASISGSSTTCLNTAIQLTSLVTGGSNLFYQWQTNASGSYADIPNANLSSYIPPVNQTGSVSYRLLVSSGSGCSGTVTSTPLALAVTGVSSVTAASACSSGALTLSANATSGSIDWYTADAGGSSLSTSNTYVTPLLSSTQTYYVAASGCASALRVPVVATIFPVTAGGIVNGATTVFTGTNSTTLTLSGNTGNIQKWQSSTDGFTLSVQDIANTSSQLTVTNLTQTTAYRTVVKSGTCASSFSSSASIIVSTILPINDKSVKASLATTGIRVEWSASDEENAVLYEIEKSVDGIVFEKIYSVVPAGNKTETKYQWIDEKPFKGNNFYRIKETLNTGKYDYSSVAKLFFANNQSGIAVYPNPVLSGTVNIQFNNIPAGNYKLKFINTTGQVIELLNLSNAGGSASQTINLSQKISKGLYKLEISGSNPLKRYTTNMIIL
jgi:hypothetical protein